MSREEAKPAERGGRKRLQWARRKRYTLPMTLMEKAVADQLEGGALEPLEGGASPLHLPDLYIEGFRGIDLIEIPRLGRVTLLAGKNGIGKTTVLEAVHAYATVGDPTYLARTLLNHQESSEEFNAINGEPLPNWQALFSGRKASRISIGARGLPRLQIEDHDLSDADFRRINERLPNQTTQGPALAIASGKRKVFFALIPMMDPSGNVTYPVRWGDVSAIPENHISCLFMHPGIIEPGLTSSLWDGAARRNEEKNAVDAAKIVLGNDLHDIIIVGESVRNNQRLAMAKIAAYQDRVPLQSLGQGAVRLFQIALALANIKNGILLIDEADFGLHYSVQRDFWRMVLQTAQDNNVQVFATTHSADCIRGFAGAANENKDVEGVLYRLSRKGGPLRAVEYDEEALAITSRQRIEVR